MQELGLIHKQSPTARLHTHICTFTHSSPHFPLIWGELVDMPTPSRKIQRKIQCFWTVRVTEQVVNTLCVSICVSALLQTHKCVCLLICVCVTQPGAPASCVNSHHCMKVILRFYLGLWSNGLETRTIHSACGQVRNHQLQHLYAWPAIRNVQIDQGHRCKCRSEGNTLGQTQ